MTRDPFAAPKVRLPPRVEFALSVVFCLLGLFLLVSAGYSRRWGTTPKEELTVVTGAATGARIEEVRAGTGATQYLWFTVGGYTTEYGQGRPGFDRVVAAIRTGKPLTIGVST